MKRFALLLLLILSATPSLSYAEELNAGFVQGIWYSASTVYANTPTRIYVALRNNTPHDLTGTVRFTDNGNRIGSSPVSALSGRLVEAWVDWKPTFGEHRISATVSDAEIHIIGEGTRAIDIRGIAVEDTLTVDYDTDADGIGNAIDADDDNDGVSDTDEKSRGTNPLVANPKVVSEIPPPTEKKSETIQSPQTPETSPREGIEKYLDSGTADTLLGNVSEKVEGAKHTLDTYRESRNNELSAAQNTKEAEQEANSENATITRSSIETKNNFLGSLVSGVAALLKNIWTFVLWSTSQGLSHPALIQVFLLLGILYIFYRLARRIGRRPRM